MKHILFPTTAAADAFIAEMQQKGIHMGSSTYNRRDVAEVVEKDGSPALGAVAGGVTGAAAGFLGTAAAIAAGVATGGLAVPVMLGAAAVGAVAGAAQQASEETVYETSDTYYDRLNSTITGGGRVVAVADNISGDVLDAAARHGGEVVDATNDVTRLERPAGDRSTVREAAGAVGNKIEEGADRLRAAGHEVAAAVTGNPKHDVLAAADRAKAEMNNAQAHADYNAAKVEVKDGDGH